MPVNAFIQSLKNQNASQAQIMHCRTTTGIANVIGNTTLIIRDYIKSLFPKNFFQDEFIDTQMIQNEMDGNVLVHKSKPILVIRPKVEFTDDTYFGRLPDWMNSNYYIFKDLKGSYLPVLKDDENQIYMYCNGDRIKMTFEIEIIVESKMKQLNTAYFLKYSTLHKSYFYIADRRLETEVPKYYIRQISDLLNYDLKNKDERSNFNRYLNQHSQNFIEEKIKLSSGNYSHFFLYAANLLCQFDSDPDMDDGDTQGMIMNNFKISDRLTVEFWTPNIFFLEVGRKFRPLDIRDYNFIEDMGEKISVHLTMTFPLPTKVDDMEYVTKIQYITDDDIEIDKVDISPLFTKYDVEVIKYAKKRKIHLKEIYHIDLYLDNEKVDNKNISIDWKKLELTQFHPKINESYTMVLYKSVERYNRTRHIIDTLRNKNYN